jgi:DNA invertase Pin-like site-specific DNA recombinase
LGLSYKLTYKFDSSTITISLIYMIGQITLIVGYARTSTREQQAGFNAQLVELGEAGCTKIFKEQVSAVSVRDQLGMALDFVREGDTLVVCKLDRLARSVQHLCEIVDTLQKKGTTLKILNIGLDTGTATGLLMLNLLGSIAQFERAMMLERQRDGIAAAKASGRYKGRKPTARAKADQIVQLLAEGKTRQAVADELQIGIASVYRVLSQQRQAT